MLRILEVWCTTQLSPASLSFSQLLQLLPASPSFSLWSQHLLLHFSLSGGSFPLPNYVLLKLLDHCMVTVFPPELARKKQTKMLPVGLFPEYLQFPQNKGLFRRKARIQMYPTQSSLNHFSKVSRVGHSSGFQPTCKNGSEELPSFAQGVFLSCGAFSPKPLLGYTPQLRTEAGVSLQVLG